VIDSELATILSESAGLTASEATDLTNGRFVVEITPDEMRFRSGNWVDKETGEEHGQICERCHRDKRCYRDDAD
jgi:hypothetical protein